MEGEEREWHDLITVKDYSGSFVENGLAKKWHQWQQEAQLRRK